jgi:hypothetical protein
MDYLLGKVRNLTTTEKPPQRSGDPVTEHNENDLVVIGHGSEEELEIGTTVMSLDTPVMSLDTPVMSLDTPVMSLDTPVMSEKEIEDISKRLTDVEIDEERSHKRMKFETENQTTTENGEFAFTGTGHKNLDFFGNTNRDASTDTIINNFIDAWNEHPQTALKILYNMRDARSGKGEKFISRLILFFIKKHRPTLYSLIINDMLELGSWKDLLYICELGHNYDKTSMELEVDLFADQLRHDFIITLCDPKSLKNDPMVKQKSVSLCAKWAPGENTHYNKKGLKIANKIMQKLNMRPNQYRKMLSNLRRKISVLESDMSQKKFTDIKFEGVPSKCHMIHRKAFMRDTNADGLRDPLRDVMVKRYQEYLSKLTRGITKVNFKGIQPHEIISHYMSGHCGPWATEISAPLNTTLIEAQWNAIVADIQKSGTFERAIAVSDVSGSMAGTPMHVSVALGLLMAECCRGSYHNKLITFSNNPTMYSLANGSLYQKLQSIRWKDWGISTDIEKVFNMILDEAKKNKLEVREMIEKVFIFTDMQFDQVVLETGSQSETKKTFDKMRDKYAEHGYELPQIICWNLRTVGAVPFHHDDNGVAMLSGFSPELLRCVMDGSELTPIGVMNRALQNYKVPVNHEVSRAVKMKNNFNMNKLGGSIASIHTSISKNRYR